MRAVATLLIEARLGYSPALQQRIGHPVQWIGQALESLEARWNDPAHPPLARRAAGVATVALLVGGAALAGVAGERLLRKRRVEAAVMLALTLPGLAQRSLREHVQAVARPLAAGDLPTARTALARIVGRDVEALDASGIAAAAIESLAESFNDGVVAPAVWLAVGGLPGLWAYKAANTADSMIGHREPRWRDFGWAAARLDDAMNLVPARLAGMLLALAGGGAWRVMLRDSGKTASPNAGWPEAAIAGALGVRLGGAACYDGEPVQRPWLGEGERPGPEHVDDALAIYGRACLLLGLGVGAAELMAWRVRRRP